MAQRRSGEEKRAFWRMAIQMQGESGLTVVKFCQREGLKPATFFGWRRRLERESTASSKTAAKRDHRSAGSPPQLVPVRLIEEHDRASVEVVAPDGFMVRVPDEAGTDNVRRVLQLLRDAS